MLGIGNSIHTGGVTSASEFSLAFDGAGDYVSFSGHTYVINPGGAVDFAVAFWAKRAGTGTQDVVLSNVNGYYRRMYFDAAGTKLYIESDTNGEEAYATVTADTNWHHYIINSRHSGSGAANVTMYEDGVASVVTNTNFGNVSGSGFTVNQIGDDAGGTNAFHGNLTQLITFNKVLGASDRDKLANLEGYYNVELDTLANWHFILHAWEFNQGAGHPGTHGGGTPKVPQFLGTLQGNTSWSEDSPNG